MGSSAFLEEVFQKRREKFGPTRKDGARPIRDVLAQPSQGGDLMQKNARNEQSGAGRPDLVIEIALTSGGLSKRAFYAKFRVPEIWIWRKDHIEVHVFDEQTNQWQETRESRVLPGIPIDAVETCAILPSITQAVCEFRKWATS